jgi:hypothetical protein
MKSDTAIKVGVVLGSIAIGLGAVGVISYATRSSICVPPAVPEKCPPNPALPPAGYKPWSGTVPPEITTLAVSALAYPMGTWLPGPSGTGVLLEWHYHPPCGALKPWGCHKGATAYRSAL